MVILTPFDFCIPTRYLPARMRNPIFNPHKRDNVIPGCYPGMLSWGWVPKLAAWWPRRRSRRRRRRPSPSSSSSSYVVRHVLEIFRRDAINRLNSPLRAAPQAPRRGIYIVECFRWNVILISYATCQCIHIGVLSTPRTHNVSRARA